MYIRWFDVDNIRLLASESYNHTYIVLLQTHAYLFRCVVGGPSCKFGLEGGLSELSWI